MQFSEADNWLNTFLGGYQKIIIFYIFICAVESFKVNKQILMKHN